MRVALDHDRCAVLIGDAGQLDLPEHSIDAIVTDPPAGVGFMGRGWDKAPARDGGLRGWSDRLAATMAPSVRALRPGGHALVWALPRTAHWTALALEGAGLEIRDVMHHVFGTGFPKSLTSASAAIPEGMGTAMKPAVEHWILCRKPLDGSVAANYAAHGTGLLNVDACRIGTTKCVPSSAARDRIGQIAKGDERGRTTDTPGFDANVGRWPAHLSLEHADACEDGPCVIGCPVRLLDEQSGILKTRGNKKPSTARAARGGRTFALTDHSCGPEYNYAGSGGASRFFYASKPTRAERDLGLDDLEPLTGGEATGRADDSAGTSNPRAGAGRMGGARNTHPTVKRVALMRWLLRLVTPPGGTVLDPFAGSGTTGVAALAEGLAFIGAELAEDPRYEAILVGRLRHALGACAG